MKQYFFQIIILMASLSAMAQGASLKPDSKANKYFQEAMSRYYKNSANRDSMAPIYRLLDQAIKEDDHFYNAYSEIVAFHCQYDEYVPACRTMVKMAQIFPTDIFSNLLCGALEYKTGHKPEAAKYYNIAIKLVDGIPEKFRNGDRYNNALSYKGIALILLDRAAEGNGILRKLYNDEGSDVIKSHLAYYLNCKNKDQVIDEVIPGKWN